jgi:hypothetical protein
LGGCSAAPRANDIGSQRAGGSADARCWIVTNRSVRDSAPLELALADLRQTVAWALSVGPEQIRVREQPDRQGAAAVTVGVSAEPPNSAATPAREGYRIQSNGKDRTTVAGDSVSLLVPGLYRLIECLRIDREALFTTNEEASPAFEYRLLAATPLVYKCDAPLEDDAELNALFQRAAASGYNMVVGRGNVSRSALFTDIDADLLPPGSPGRTRTQRNREYLARFCRGARAFGLIPVVGGDEFEYPAEVTDRPYFSELTEQGYTPEQPAAQSGTGPIFCYVSSRLWRLHDAKYDEILRAFPEVGAVMVRLGENYTHLSGGQYIGNGVYAFDDSALCPACRDIPYEDRIARLINRTAKIVCGRYKRLYLHRTWDTEFDRFHACPDVYDRIVQRVKPVDGLFFVTKYTIGDFWRRSAMNPTIGRGGPPRMVEFQCAREYEGKGAYPNWLGAEYSRAYQCIRDRNVVGVSNWHRGGGWGGPVPPCDLWNDANWYLVDHLAWQPERDPEALAREWATIRFGPQAGPRVARLLCLSEQAVEKLRYFGCYGPADARSLPVHDWMRDDVIRGRQWLSQIAAEHPEQLDVLIAEKQEAVRLIDQMMALVEQAKEDICAYDPPPRLSLEPQFPAGQALFDSVSTSLRYERTLAATVRDLVTAYFLCLQWQENPESVQPDRIEAATESWEKHWAQHQDVCRHSPLAATPYRDDGMQATIDYVRACLERGPDLRFTWQVLGPFPNPDNRNFQVCLPPENEIQLDAPVTWEGKSFRWQALPRRFYRDGLVDFDGLYGGQNWVLAYAFTTFHSESEQPAVLRIGSDDGVRVWLNGQLQHSLDTARAAVPDEDMVPVRLRAGRNALLVKNADRNLGWGFYLRITDAEGRPLRTIRASAP